MGEYRIDIGGDSSDLLRKFRDQMGEKRRRVFRGRFSDLRMNVSGNVLDGKEDRKDLADVAGGANFDEGDFKTVGPLQCSAGKRRTLGSPTDLAEPVALQTSI